MNILPVKPIPPKTPEELYLDKFLHKVSDDEIFITANILDIVENKPETYNEIKFNEKIMGHPNLYNTNAYNILLANGYFKQIEEIINNDKHVLEQSNAKEPLIQSLLRYPQMHGYLQDFIQTKIGFDTDCFIVSNNEDKTFISRCIDYIQDGQYENQMATLVIETLNRMFDWTGYPERLYEASIELTTVCRRLRNNDIVDFIISNSKLTDVYVVPDFDNKTMVDYLVMEYRFESLMELLDVVKTMATKSLMPYVELIRVVKEHKYDTDPLIPLILKLCQKSNIYNVYGKDGENLIAYLLTVYPPTTDIEIKALSTVMHNFDIFEQDNNRQSIFTLATGALQEKTKQLFVGKFYADSQLDIQNPYNINVMTLDMKFSPNYLLTPTETGKFEGFDYVEDILFLLQSMKYENVMQTMYMKNYKIDAHNVFKFSNIRNLHATTEDIERHNGFINEMIGRMKKGYSGIFPYKVMYVGMDYYIYYDIVNLINSSAKRFVVFDLSIFPPTGGHANILIVDKHLKTVERFEPYGSYGADFVLDSLLKTQIATPLGYEYVFCVCSGMQARAYEHENYVFGDPDGYCVAWCQLILELRMNPAYMDWGMCKLIKVLSNYIINRFKQDYHDEYNGEQNPFTLFIRYYANTLHIRKNELERNLNMRFSNIELLMVDLIWAYEQFIDGELKPNQHMFYLDFPQVLPNNPPMTTFVSNVGQTENQSDVVVGGGKNNKEIKKKYVVRKN